MKTNERNNGGGKACRFALAAALTVAAGAALPLFASDGKGYVVGRVGFVIIVR